jgi:hypothetical protein
MNAGQEKEAELSAMPFLERFGFFIAGKRHKLRDGDRGGTFQEKGVNVFR